MRARPDVAIETLHGQRRSLVMWLVGLAALVALYVAVYPSVRGETAYSKLIDQMPKAYKALFTAGSGADLSSAAGYLNTELFTFMGPLLVLVYAINAGAGAIAGEEDRRTMDLLLVQGVSRRRVIVEKFGAVVAGTAILVLGLWCALLAEGRLVALDVPVLKGAGAVLHLALLGIEFGSVALLVGAATGRVGMSRAVPAMLAVTAYLVNGLAPLVHWLRPVRKASPFYQYIGHDPLRTGTSIAAITVTALSITVLVLVTMAAFARRDVGA